MFMFQAYSSVNHLFFVEDYLVLYTRAPDLECYAIAIHWQKLIETWTLDIPVIKKYFWVNQDCH